MDRGREHGVREGMLFAVLQEARGTERESRLLPAGVLLVRKLEAQDFSAKLVGLFARGGLKSGTKVMTLPESQFRRGLVLIERSDHAMEIAASDGELSPYPVLGRIDFWDPESRVVTIDRSREAALLLGALLDIARDDRVTAQVRIRLVFPGNAAANLLGTPEETLREGDLVRSTPER